jgi:hypothetical protein
MSDHGVSVKVLANGGVSMTFDKGLDLGVTYHVAWSVDPPTITTSPVPTTIFDSGASAYVFRPPRARGGVIYDGSSAHTWRLLLEAAVRLNRPP